MQTYISFLRGVNVSGHNKIKMAQLKTSYETLGFESVQTYIQSGNVVFKTGRKSSPDKISRAIQKQITDDFDLMVPVLVRSLQELLGIVAANPFSKSGLGTERLYVTLLEEAPAKEQIAKIKKWDDCADEFVVLNKEIYLHCGEGYGKTRYSNQFFEKQLGAIATTRNWKTLNKLIALAEH